MLEEERSALLVIEEDCGALLFVVKIHEEEALVDLGVAHKRIAT